MNPILKNILAVIVGALAGGIVNMGIIQISGSIIPYPEGTDISTPESLSVSIHLFKPINFLMPFLAHALGTFVGALVAALIAMTHKMKFALAIGVLNLFGGIMAVNMIPAPMWFNVIDLVVAYLPMAFLGGKMAIRKNKNRNVVSSSV